MNEVVWIARLIVAVFFAAAVVNGYFGALNLLAGHWLHAAISFGLMAYALHRTHVAAGVLHAVKRRVRELP